MGEAILLGAVSLWIIKSVVKSVPTKRLNLKFRVR
jgi:hypothetical protein